MHQYFLLQHSQPDVMIGCLDHTSTILETILHVQVLLKYRWRLRILTTGMELYSIHLETGQLELHRQVLSLETTIGLTIQQFLATCRQAGNNNYDLAFITYRIEHR